jgi:hypothetical protein
MEWGVPYIYRGDVPGGELLFGAEGLVAFEGEFEELGDGVLAPLGLAGLLDCELDELAGFPGGLFDEGDVGDVALDRPGFVPGAVGDCVGAPGVLEEDGVEVVGEFAGDDAAGEEVVGVDVEGVDVEGDELDGAVPDVAPPPPDAPPPDAPDPPPDCAWTAAAPKVVRAVAMIT